MLLGALRLEDLARMTFASARRSETIGYLDTAAKSSNGIEPMFYHGVCTDASLGGVLSQMGGRYVGSTLHLRKRRNLHLCLLRSGRHHAPHLQAAWNVY